MFNLLQKLRGTEERVVCVYFKKLVGSSQFQLHVSKAACHVTSRSALVRAKAKSFMAAQCCPAYIASLSLSFSFFLSLAQLNSPTEKRRDNGLCCRSCPKKAHVTLKVHFWFPPESLHAYLSVSFPQRRKSSSSLVWVDFLLACLGQLCVFVMSRSGTLVRLG